MQFTGFLAELKKVASILKEYKLHKKEGSQKWSILILINTANDIEILPITYPKLTTTQFLSDNQFFTIYFEYP